MNFTDTVMTAVRRSFASYGHRPSQSQMDALADIPRTINQIIHGEHRGHFLLSAIDCGIGKTQTVAHSVREIMTNPAYADRSILVCIPRLSEIRAFVQSIDGIDDFAVYAGKSERELRAMGRGIENAGDARLLISTQASVRLLLKGDRMLADVEELKFRGRLRDVRIWDEFLQPSLDVAIPIHSLFGLGSALVHQYPDLADDLMELAADVRHADDGARVEIPDLVNLHPDVDVAMARSFANSAGADDMGTALENLFDISGLRVVIRKGAGKASAVLTFREYLPPDFTPVVILDASGRIRQLYQEFAKNGSELVDLKRATKSYGPFTVHLWDRSGAKRVFANKSRESAAEVVEAYARLIRQEAPRGNWLVLHHGGDRNRRYLVDIKAMLAKELRDLRPIFVDHDYQPEADVQQEAAKLERQGLTLAMLNWGRHDATNAFKLFDHVIAMGVQYEPDAVTEAKVRAAGKVPVDQDLDPDRLKEAKLGELKHLLLQAANRSSIRMSDGPSCRPARMWINASAGSGVTQELFQFVFPGCTVKAWEPVPRHHRSRRVAEALEILRATFMRSCSPLQFSELAHTMGMDRGDFRSRVRLNPVFQRELERMGLQEVSVTGYRGFDAFAPMAVAFAFEVEDAA